MTGNLGKLIRGYQDIQRHLLINLQDPSLLRKLLSNKNRGKSCLRVSTKTLIFIQNIKEFNLLICKTFIQKCVSLF